MGKITLDEDVLRHERATLEARIRAIDEILKLAVPVEPAPPSLPIIQAQQRMPERSKIVTSGLRKSVTLALHTGRSTIHELAKALGWTTKQAVVVISSMHRQKIVFQTETGQWALSKDGQTQADWFLKHPDNLTYRPHNNNGTIR